MHDTLRVLLSQLTLWARLAPIRLVLGGSQGPIHGQYDPGTRTVRMGSFSTELLAHEFAHAWQCDLKTSWPIAYGELASRFPKETVDAIKELVQVEHLYPDEELDNELFARIFQRVYLDLLQ